MTYAVQSGIETQFLDYKLCLDQIPVVLDAFMNRKQSPIKEAPPGWLSGERVGLMTWWL